jgi:hypothetical protein
MDWRRWNVHVYAMEGFEVSVDRTLNNKNFWRLEGLDPRTGKNAGKVPRQRIRLNAGIDGIR